MYPAWLKRALAQLTITNIGFYATLSLLTVYLVSKLHFTGAEVAMALLCSTLGLRVSRFALAPFLNMLPPRRLIGLAILASATGYLSLAYAVAPLAVSLSLLLIGTGYGCNGLAVTTLSSFSMPENRRSVYALQYTLGHSASALGPVIAGLLADDFGHFAVFLFSAFLALLSGLAILRLECDLWQPERTGFYRKASGLLQRPELRRIFASTAMGWFLYTQKYACLPLLISTTGGSARQIGGALLLFSLVIIATSLPISGFLKRLGLAEPAAITLSFALYGVGFLLVALLPTLPGLVAAILFWGIAEALLMPSLNTAIGHATEPHERLAAFSLSALFVAIGEWAGMAGGTAMFRHFEQAAAASQSFYYLAATALAFLLIHLAIHARANAYAV